MSKNLKSSQEDLRRRGMATKEHIALMTRYSQGECRRLLHAEEAETRTAAAYALTTLDRETTTQLLQQLQVEKCLYTKIAICETLQKGSVEVAKEMVKYLGQIGNNQYKKLPDKVSRKKSFPLPRDIIARALGKMKPEILPVLLEVLEGDDLRRISEVLDAIGFMVFYNKELAIKQNAEMIYQTMACYTSNPLIVYKCILCLSAFPLPESIAILEKMAQYNDILGEEARRSLKLIL